MWLQFSQVLILIFVFLSQHGRGVTGNNVSMSARTCSQGPKEVEGEQVDGRATQRPIEDLVSAQYLGPWK